jgi:MFS family permease
LQSIWLSGQVAEPIGVDNGYPQALNLRRAHQRRAVLASTLGTTIEWYDFFLYGTAAALIFPKVFFPGSSAYMGVLASFATLFVGFAARPVGAAIFGHYGDRVGRKATLARRAGCGRHSRDP